MGSLAHFGEKVLPFREALSSASHSVVLGKGPQGLRRGGGVCLPETAHKDAAGNPRVRRGLNRVERTQGTGKSGPEGGEPLRYLLGRDLMAWLQPQPWSQVPRSSGGTTCARNPSSPAAPGGFWTPPEDGPSVRPFLRSEEGPRQLCEPDPGCHFRGGFAVTHVRKVPPLHEGD